MKKEVLNRDKSTSFIWNYISTTKGITLIALIITIILLLILASVVLNIALGENGLFKIAKQAAKNYTNAEAIELADLNNITNIIDQATNGEIEKPTVTIDVNLLKAGDYIKYDSGEKGIITCRVLYPVSSKYGLQIISDKNVKEVTLESNTYSEAVESYNNAIETLNNEAEGYINTDYAYDARCVGSLPMVANGMFSSKDTGATTYVTPQFSNFSYINSLDEDANYETDFAQMDSIGILKTGQDYWLASRKVNSNSETCDFLVRRVFYNDGGLSNVGLCYVYSNGLTYYGNSVNTQQGLRPCISIKSDIIKITSGDGKSAGTAYIIEK